MQNTIETIPNDCGAMTIRYNPRYSVICSVGNAPFGGIMEIEYCSADKLLEFESFERWLLSIANERETIESLCRLVFDNLTASLGEIPLTVKVNAETQVHSPASAMIQR